MDERERQWGRAWISICTHTGNCKKSPFRAHALKWCPLSLCTAYVAVVKCSEVDMDGHTSSLKWRVSRSPPKVVFIFEACIVMQLI